MFRSLLRVEGRFWYWGAIARVRRRGARARFWVACQLLVQSLVCLLYPGSFD
jgi:hypothetical protein